MNFFEQSPHSQGLPQARLRAVRRVPRQPRRRARRPRCSSARRPNATCMKCHSKDDKPRKVAERHRGAARRRAPDRAAEARDAGRARGRRGPARRRAQLRARQARDRGAQAARRRPHARSGARRGARRRRRPRRRRAPCGSWPTPSRSRKLERRDYFVALALAGLLFVTLGAQGRSARHGGGGRTSHEPHESAAGRPDGMARRTRSASRRRILIWVAVCVRRAAARHRRRVRTKQRVEHDAAFCTASCHHESALAKDGAWHADGARATSSASSATR